MSTDTDGQLRAYLDDELDPDARAEVEAELERSPELRAQFDELRVLGEEVGALLGQADVRADSERDWDRLVARARPSRWRGAAVAAVATLAAAVLLFVWLGGGSRHAEQGSRVAKSRQTVNLGDRAVAVAEAGAELEWQIGENDDAVVRQSHGAVFYRVEAGGTFEVRTPAGSVEVTGTCFTVEVVAMKEWIKRHGKGALVGAAAGAALMLTVHEGSVVLANDEGSIEVGAGDRAHVASGAPRRSTEGDEPTLVGDHDSVIRELRQRDAKHRLKIAALEKELGREPPSGEDSPAELIQRCANSVGHPDCSDVEPEQDVLQEMARCGSIKIDRPEFLSKNTPDGYAPAPELVSLVNLSADEIGKITEANRVFAEQYSKQLQGIISELNDGKTVPIPNGAPPWAIISSFTSVLDAAVPQDQVAQVRRLVAQERAGQATPPEDVPGLHPLERYERIRADVGDTYEAELAEAIGTDRAHELRVAKDGWGQGELLGGTCPDDNSEEND